MIFKKDPQPADKWIKPKECSEAGSSAPSLNFITNTVIGSEDCLVLNVYTKEVVEYYSKMSRVNVMKIIIILDQLAFT